MSSLRSVIWLFSVAVMVVGSDIAVGQDYPSKPIRILTAAAGGGNDFLSRIIAPAISLSLGQPVVVENRPNGPLSPEAVSKAAPDGYTLLINSSFLWVGQFFQKAPYDPVKDFSPITTIATEPNLLVVNASVPVKSVNELIALAKANPGKLNYSATSLGGSSYLGGNLFKSMAGINIVEIDYKENSQELIDLLSGQVHISFQGGIKMRPHIQAGKLKALAVTSAQPTPLAPGLPTVAASVPGFELVSLSGLFAPAKTPQPIINRLNQEVVRLLRTSEVKEQLFNNGTDPVGSSPEELAAHIKAEIERLGKLTKALGIKPAD